MRTFLLWIVFLCQFGFTQSSIAQACLPSSPAQGTAIDEQWTAYAYNGNNINFSSNTYRGYYVDNNTYGPGSLSFDSRRNWGENSSPSATTGYEGCSVNNDAHSVRYVRKSFPAGTYRIKLQHNDGARLLIDGNQVYTANNNVNNDVTLTQTYTLNSTSIIEFQVREINQASLAKIEFIPTTDLILFGQNKWETAVYNTANFTNYYGSYIQSGLNFTTTDLWIANDNNRASSAPGYVGAPVTNAVHSYTYRRRGFPCGFYQIDVRRHDDESELIVNGNSVNSLPNWSNANTPNVWNGYLGPDSTIQFKIANTGGGPTSGALNFIRLDDTAPNETMWTGRINSDISNPNNWCPSLPDATLDAFIPSDDLTQNSPNLNVNISMKSLRLHSNASINLSTNELSLTGSFVNTGSIVNETINHLNLQGANAEVAGNGFSINTLRIENSGVSLNLIAGEEVRVNNVVQIPTGSFATNNQLTLACRFDDLTQRVAQIDNLSNASITGNVLTEQCIPARRSFRFVTPPVTTNTTIHQNWQEGASTVDDNPNPGYGTHITGTGTNADQWNGFDITPSGNASLYLFNNASQNWFSVNNTDNTNLIAGNAYRLMVRGDRSLDIQLNTATPNNTILRARGTVRSGDINMADNFSAASEAFNFFGNPYPAAVNMFMVMEQSSNLQKDYYVWDATLGGAASGNSNSTNLGGRGAYVTIDLETPNSAVPPANANQFLQPGQAAFVKATGSGIPQMIFKESYKDVQEDQTAIFRPTNQEIVYTDLTLYKASGIATDETALDGIRIKFGDQYTTTPSNEDASKLGNLDENIVVVNDGSYLAIDRREFPETEEIIPLFMSQYRHNNYSIRFTLNDWPGMQMYMIDYYLNEETEITHDGFLYHFGIDAEIPESIDASRFALKLKPSSILGTNDIEKNVLVMYPNPLQGNQLNFQLPSAEAQTWSIQITDVLGKVVVKQQQNLEQNGLRLNNLQLASGVYVVSLKNEKGTAQYSQKLIVE